MNSGLDHTAAVPAAARALAMPHRRSAGALLVATSLCFLAACPSACQTDRAPDLPAPGQIGDVSCAADPAQSYALYLPSTYTAVKRWPMIYFFDPGGHGSRPVELYKDIAEKYGFVIAGSNNSRNFSPDQSKSVKAIWLDTHERLALNEHRIYTSGFSGGARIAGAMALSCPPCQIAGVVAHGAGYPNNGAVNLEAGNKTLYFFAIGNRDFNWPEVMTIRREREEKGLPYRLQVFSGTHQWAPAAIMEDAVEWLILKAMQAGQLPPDAAFVDQLFRQTRGEAEEAEKKHDALEQLSALRSLVSDFAGLKDVAESEKNLEVLKKSPALKAAWKNEQEQIVDQGNLVAGISPKISAYVNGDASDSVSLRNQVLQAVAALRDQEAHSRNETTRLVFGRALDDLWVGWMETGQQELNARHFDKAEACFQLMSQVKEEPWPVFLLAETHAASGNKKLAIKDLQVAIKRGWNDPAAIESDPMLQVLKGDVDFQRLVEQLKHK